MLTVLRSASSEVAIGPEEPFCIIDRLVQEHTDVPLCIDSSIVEALEARLAAYDGKALAG